jgi:type I restriction enzyme M protein
MARANLEGDMNTFLSTLRNLGSAGNGALRDALGWAESRYWKAHAALFESGKIQKGRGRGGSVSTGSNRGKTAGSRANGAASKRAKSSVKKPGRKR